MSRNPFLTFLAVLMISMLGLSACNMPAPTATPRPTRANETAVPQDDPTAVPPSPIPPTASSEPTRAPEISITVGMTTTVPLTVATLLKGGTINCDDGQWSGLVKDWIQPDLLYATNSAVARDCVVNNNLTIHVLPPLGVVHADPLQEAFLHVKAITNTELLVTQFVGYNAIRFDIRELDKTCTNGADMEFESLGGGTGQFSVGDVTVKVIAIGDGYGYCQGNYVVTFWDEDKNVERHVLPFRISLINSVP